MSTSPTPPSRFEDEGRPAIVIALASLGMAVMELTKAVKVEGAAKEAISKQLDDVAEALATLTGEFPEVLEEKAKDDS